MTNLKMRDGFLLLETMIGVAVFSLGMLALARCLEQCIGSETARTWDERARTALENRAAEIEAGAISIEANKEEKLSGAFEGFTIKQTRTPLHFKDESGNDLSGIFQIQLDAVWREGAGQQTKTLTFYVYPQP